MLHWYDEAVLEAPSMITPEVLERMVPQCLEPELWAHHWGTWLDRYGVEDIQEIALVIAQAGHESASFRELEESLNYGVEALSKLFGAHRISRLDIQMYGRKRGQRANEEALGNILYGGTWGARNLGNTEPGDGYQFRGRGLFQLTGRANYEACAADTGLDIVHDPDLLCRDAEAAVISALWFWSTRVTSLNVKASTRQINGGFNGLADRVARFKRALAVMEGLV